MAGASIGDHERVRSLLRDAFQDAHKPRSGFAWDVASHDELVNVRSAMFFISAEDMHYALPRMLEDMLDHRRGDAWDEEDEDRLLAHLMAASWGDEVNQFLEDQYRLFTRAQSEAVVEWLRLAGTWDEYALVDKDRVNEAIDYWSARVRRQE